MKVSEWLRKYQITGEVPDDADDSMIPFWCGWLIARKIDLRTPEESIDMAIKVAEFIEAHAR